MVKHLACARAFFLADLLACLLTYSHVNAFRMFNRMFNIARMVKHLALSSACQSSSYANVSRCVSFVFARNSVVCLSSVLPQGRSIRSLQREAHAAQEDGAALAEVCLLGDWVAKGSGHRTSRGICSDVGRDFTERFAFRNPTWSRLRLCRWTARRQLP